MLSQGVAGAGKLAHRDQFCNNVSLTARTSRPTRKVTVANRHGHSIHAVAEAPVLPFSKDAEHLEQWSKTSWRKRTAHQQPEYIDKDQLQEAVAEIQRMPPLVFAGECRTLQARLAKCAAGESFMLTGGDCAGIYTPLDTMYAVDFTCISSMPDEEISCISLTSRLAPLHLQFFCRKLLPVLS